MRITEDAGKGIKQGAEGVSQFIQTGERNKWAFTIFILLLIIGWLVYDNLTLRNDSNQLRDAIITDQRKQINDLKDIKKIIDTTTATK